MDAQTVIRHAVMLASSVIGVIAAGIASTMLPYWADLCPDFESEGPSAAPGSAYSAWMCTEPDQSFSRAWLVVAAIAVVALVVAFVVRRRPGLFTIGLLVVPALLIGLLHVALPRDCSTGRTETGDCARDREMF